MNSHVLDCGHRPVYVRFIVMLCIVAVLLPELSMTVGKVANLTCFVAKTICL